MIKYAQLNKKIKKIWILNNNKSKGIKNAVVKGNRVLINNQRWINNFGN